MHLEFTIRAKLPQMTTASRSSVSPNAYLFETGHLYTSPSTTLIVRMRAYGMIVMTVSGRKKFSMGGSCAKREYTVAVVKPGGRYAVAADRVPLVAAVVNPLHPAFAAFRSLKLSAPGCPPRKAFATLDSSLSAALEGRLSIVQANKLFNKIVAIAMQFIAPSSAVDPRVTKALRLLANDRHKSMTKLSKTVGLSYFRLSHLFTDSIGISLRNYLLWQKIHKIPILHSRGATLAQIAKKTGFTDPAHLAHTFREVFGAPPSYFFSGNAVRISSWLDTPKKRRRK